MAGIIYRKFKSVVCVMFAVLCCFFIAAFHTQAEENEEQNIAAPELVGAKAVNASTIRVSWKSADENNGCYVIYRKSGKSDYNIHNIVLAKDKTNYSYLDTTVVNGTNYTYTVAYVPAESFVTIGYQSGMYSSSTGAFSASVHIDSDIDTDKKAALYLICTEDEVVKKYSTKPDDLTVDFYWDYEDRENAPTFTPYVLYEEGWSGYDTAGVSAKTTLAKTTVTTTKLVATGKIRINWKKSKGATGYVVYKRAKGNKTWMKLAVIEGDSQLYCYDDSVAAGKTYYYTVKAYVEAGGVKKYAAYDKTGTKAYYKSVKIKTKSGDYSVGSVYGPKLSNKQLSEVKKVVDSFCKEYITSDMTQVEKVLTAQLYMMSNCIYAADWSKNGANTAWGSLVYKNSYGYHEAQCSGFARGFKALCDGMGIPCRYVHANSKSANPSHQWNEVKIGNKWYIVDPQCNATSGGLFYFLCSGTTYKSESGMAWDTSQYPKVSSADYSREKIGQALNGYKIQQVMKKCKLSYGS